MQIEFCSCRSCGHEIGSDVMFCYCGTHNHSYNVNASSGFALPSVAEVAEITAVQKINKLHRRAHQLRDELERIEQEIMDLQQWGE